MSDEFCNEDELYGRDRLYLCDPKKNKECKKTCCYEMNLNPLNGECRYTLDPRFRKNGKVFRYNTKTHKIEEVSNDVFKRSNEDTVRSD